MLVAGARLVASGRLAAEKLTLFVFYVGFVSSASFDVADQWAKARTTRGARARAVVGDEAEPPARARSLSHLARPRAVFAPKR